MGMYLTGPDFLKNILSQKMWKWGKNRGFLLYWKISTLIFPEFGLNESMYYLQYSYSNHIF